MERSVKSAIENNGYVFLKEYLSGKPSEEVALHFGRPITPWEGGLLQNLIPRAVATPNTYSGLYGLGHFPYHTDLAHWAIPPRYLLLRCMKGYSEVQTFLLDGKEICNKVDRDLLIRGIVKPRRPKNGKFELLNILKNMGGDYCLRWDETFLNSASKIGEIAVQKIKEVISLSSPNSVSLIASGDMLLIDNWRMLHARSEIPSYCGDRQIQRIYLESLC